MAIYEFQRENDLKIVEKRFPMGECPRSIVCDDGVTAHKIFSIPNLIIKDHVDSKILDQQKIRQEAVDRADEIGMQNFIPMKRQNPEQQLKDIKENRSLFAEKMAEGQEKTLRKQRERMKAISEKNRSKNPAETYMRRQEKLASIRQKQNTINL